MKSDLTRNQEVVHSALRASDKALTAYEVLDLVRASGMRAPTQIYRALERLIELGLVHRIESMNAFVACSHDHGAGHAHGNGDVVAFAICQDCGDVNELTADSIEASVDSLARQGDFVPESAIVELRGHCAECNQLKGQLKG